MPKNFSLVQAASSDQVISARQLFNEYAAGLEFSLCFQNFDQEIAELPGKYSPPSGRLLLAFIGERMAGCIGLRKLDEETCEMKRLFLRPEFRGKGLGRELVSAVLHEARMIGYTRMRLDTLPGKMDSAISLYRAIGFRDISPYYNNPVEGATFMELDL
jgi:putative acetyltransferase